MLRWFSLCCTFSRRPAFSYLKSLLVLLFCFISNLLHFHVCVSYVAINFMSICFLCLFSLLLQVQFLTFWQFSMISSMLRISPLFGAAHLFLMLTIYSSFLFCWVTLVFFFRLFSSFLTCFHLCSNHFVVTTKVCYIEDCSIFHYVCLYVMMKCISFAVNEVHFRTWFRFCILLKNGS